MTGLTDIEVQKQIQAGNVNGKTHSITKSIPKIIQENTCTLFNLLNVIIACALFYVGAYSNMFFIIIILMNILVGIFQQIKAKKLVDQLSILNEEKVRVVRNGKETCISKEEIVKGDVLVLKSGMQVCNDARIIQGNVEMNESLLTGESDGVNKSLNDQLLSGSFVIAGKAYAQVIHTGEENYASKLVHQVKETKNMHSEFLDSMKKVTGFTTVLIIPLGIMLMIEAFYFRNASFSESIINTSAALLGMLPKGLVLLMSVSLTNGVIELSKKKILVQNAYALETMAHIDTLCLDKTGTITTGELKVKEVLSLHKFEANKVNALMESYMAACVDNNATFTALKEHFKAKQNYKIINRIPFDSKRKWGAISFQDAGTVIVGAPELLLKELPLFMEQALNRGDRILAVAYSSDSQIEKGSLPRNTVGLYGIVLEDQIRTNAKETIRYFSDDGMHLKLISGDHVQTVSTIAKKVGFHEWKDAIDLSRIKGTIDYEKLAEEYSIFARVTPMQKKKLVQAMQKRGHQVAMCGDGVNDLLAMKEADCAIAIAEGSQASKQLAEIVLLDSDFTNLPSVIENGRRAVNNVTRSAGIFFIKTIYSFFVSLLCLFMNIPFPFIPLQITLIDAFIEAYPSFITIIETDIRKIRGDFLKNTMRKALPFAMSVVLFILFVEMTHPFTMEQNQTLMYLSLITISSLAVIKSCIPFDRFRSFICVTMCSGIMGALLFMPKLFHVVPITFDMCIYFVVVLTCILILTFIMHYLFHKLLRQERKQVLRPWQA